MSHKDTMYCTKSGLPRMDVVVVVWSPKPGGFGDHHGFVLMTRILMTWRCHGAGTISDRAWSISDGLDGRRFCLDSLDSSPPRSPNHAKQTQAFFRRYRHPD